MPVALVLKEGKALNGSGALLDGHEVINAAASV